MLLSARRVAPRARPGSPAFTDPGAPRSHAGTRRSRPSDPVTANARTGLVLGERGEPEPDSAARAAVQVLAPARHTGGGGRPGPDLAGGEPTEPASRTA